MQLYLIFLARNINHERRKGNKLKMLGEPMCTACVAILMLQCKRRKTDI